MKTTTFTATHIHDNDTLFLGNAKGKHDSFVAVTEMLCNEFPETPLVVFDYGGSLYEKYAGYALLADFASEGSVIPDLLEPFLFNDRIGSSSENIAYTLRQAVYQEIRSRDANDKFFDDLGKVLTDRMFIYMLETEKNVLRNLLSAADESDITKITRRLNLFKIFCRQHRYIETLMTKTIGGESDLLPTKYRLLEEMKKKSFLTREHALAKYIFDHELRFQKNGDREAPVPFADLLYTKSDNTNTQRCIKMQADASTLDFRALLTMLSRNEPLYRELPPLKLHQWITGEKIIPLYVCSSGNAQADCGIAPLLISAVGASVQSAKREAIIIIPELDKWGLLNHLDKLRQQWPHLHFAFAYDNFSRLALESRAGEEHLLETLFSASTQRLWHSTEEERLAKAFASYVSDADVIYRPQDLNDELRMIEKDGSVRYTELTAKEESIAHKKRNRLRRLGSKSKLWLTEGLAKPEKLTLASLLEEGESL